MTIQGRSLSLTHSNKKKEQTWWQTIDKTDKKEK
jgi:hypothetical protein